MTEGQNLDGGATNAAQPVMADASLEKGDRSPTAHPSASAEKLRVFLSYSRKDSIGFADQIVPALRTCGFDPVIDRHGIAGGEAWRERLGGLIREADTVVFALSPESAVSPVCKWEVEEAVRLSKRIIPIVALPLEGRPPPPKLARLDYIFFCPDPGVPDAGLGTGLTKLVAALNTDLDWLREHTRLLTRATEWEIAGRVENRMLSGGDIGAAKAWAARRPKGAPEPTALHLDFIRASEAAEQARLDTECQHLADIAAAQDARAKALDEATAALGREAEARKAGRKIEWQLLAAVFVLGLCSLIYVDKLT